MSIQNRLLLVYALIFCVVYFLSSLVVYTLPRDQILAQIDADLYSLAAELVSSSTQVGVDGDILVPLSEESNDRSATGVLKVQFPRDRHSNSRSGCQYCT